jgi:hypothetical protein
MSGPLATTVIAHTDNASLPDDSRFEQWSGAAYLGKDASGVCILLVDEPESRTLNARYRGHDKPTNVLSFPMRLPEHLGALALGDLVICAPVVEREAREQGRAVLAHWAPTRRSCTGSSARSIPQVSASSRRPTSRSPASVTACSCSAPSLLP